MDHVWTIQKPMLVKTESIVGPVLDQIGTRIEPNINQIRKR